jgi:SHS2 domain-containing protein
MYRWVDHTSEVELAIEAATEQEVLTDALAAFAELSGERPDGPLEERTLDLAAPDRARLLAEWLGELAYLAEVEGFVPERAASLTLDRARLHARVAGRRGRPAHLVKAVTWHRLRFEPGEGGWEATVVLDV